MIPYLPGAVCHVHVQSPVLLCLKRKGSFHFYLFHPQGFLTADCLFVLFVWQKSAESMEGTSLRKTISMRKVSCIEARDFVPCLISSCGSCRVKFCAVESTALGRHAIALFAVISGRPLHSFWFAAVHARYSDRGSYGRRVAVVRCAILFMLRDEF